MCFNPFKTVVYAYGAFYRRYGFALRLISHLKCNGSQFWLGVIRISSMGGWNGGSLGFPDPVVLWGYFNNETHMDVSHVLSKLVI